ncbi:MAG: GNVR domain-containing protein [FCB group bacterium]
MIKIIKGPSTQMEELTINLVYKLCLLHKKFLFLFVISILLLTLVLSFVLPSEYEATATVLPPDDTESHSGLSSYLQNLSGGVSLPGINQGNKIQLLGEIVKSREVAKYIVDKCKLKNYPQFKNIDDESLYNAIINNIDVQVKRTGLMVISTTMTTGYFPSEKDKNTAAELSALMANTAIEGLDFINRIKNVSKAKRKRIFIEHVLNENKLKLDSVDSALESFQNSNKVLALDEQTKAILENAVHIGSEISMAQIDLNLAELDFDPGSPKVLTYKKRVNQLQNQYNRIQSGGLVSGDKFSIPLNEVPKLFKEYTNLVRDQKILLQVNMYLETQKFQEAIQEESDVITVEFLDKAVQPQERSAPSRKMMLLLGFILSSFFGVGIVITWSFIKGRFYFKKSNADNKSSEQ